MTINDRIIIKNYKCFDNEGVELEKICPINIIIGKNNSGKSSLLDVIEYLANPSEGFISNGRDGKKTDIIIEHTLTENDIKEIFPVGTSTSYISDLYDYGKKFIGKKYAYFYEAQGWRMHETDISFHSSISMNVAYVGKLIEKPLKEMTFLKISSERDVIPEVDNHQMSVDSKGSGVTTYLQNFINNKELESSLVEVELLQELNKILIPDIEFKRIFVQRDQDKNMWEIYFIDVLENILPLSKMGSGLKTIILVLVNLIIKVQNSIKSFLFAFEELENNLHPSLQRRLFNYIRDYSINNSAYFFITTHSSVVIDVFVDDPNSQLINISNKNGISSLNAISSYNDIKSTISELGLKASDILQTNGIIWVEGPTDRYYLNKWLNIECPELKEGLHYSIMFYGGKLLSHLTFNELINDERFIKMIKINTNFYILIDKDDIGKKGKIRNTKDRIANEIGEKNYWITEGREIENYLSEETVIEWLKSKNEIITGYQNDKDEKFLKNLTGKLSKKNSPINYESNKSKYALEIINFISEDKMGKLNLKKNIENLVSIIKSWNFVEENSK